MLRDRTVFHFDSMNGNLKSFLENMEPTSTDLKRNGTQPFVTLQKHLHFSWCGSATDGYWQIAHLEMTINAEKYVQVSERHTLPVQTLLSGKVLRISRRHEESGC